MCPDAYLKPKRFLECDVTRLYSRLPSEWEAKQADNSVSNSSRCPHAFGTSREAYSSGTVCSISYIAGPLNGSGETLTVQLERQKIALW